MTQGFKTIAAIAAAIVVACVIAIHLFAPQLMRSLGQAIHGGH